MQEQEREENINPTLRIISLYPFSMIKPTPFELIRKFTFKEEYMNKYCDCVMCDHTW